VVVTELGFELIGGLTAANHRGCGGGGMAGAPPWPRVGGGWAGGGSLPRRRRRGGRGWRGAGKVEDDRCHEDEDD
jgi:hypothetical protein